MLTQHMRLTLTYSLVIISLILPQLVLYFSYGIKLVKFVARVGKQMIQFVDSKVKLTQFI
jgi:hypothetical protein